MEKIIEGLTSNPKRISSKYFYNEKGSKLFEQITELPEYYPTRTEREILSDIVEKVNIDFRGSTLIELGSGDPTKITLILEQIPLNHRKGLKYYPVDISSSAVEDSVKKLEKKFPEMYFEGIVADFMLKISSLPKEEKRIILFLGSTISNLRPEERELFMRKISDELNKGETVLLGVDRIKDIEIIEKAYNDQAGITAAFNKNILNNINGIIKTDFNPELFEHLAFYNAGMKRIEMHLVAKEEMVVNSEYFKEPLKIEANEKIHTENSYKFDIHDILELESFSEMKIENIFSDKKDWFSIIKFKKN